MGCLPSGLMAWCFGPSDLLWVPWPHPSALAFALASVWPALLPSWLTPHPLSLCIHVPSSEKPSQMPQAQRVCIFSLGSQAVFLYQLLSCDRTYVWLG